MAGIVESAIGMLTSVGPYVIPKLQSSVETVYSCISDYLAKFSVGAIPRGAHRGANAKGDDQIKSALRKEDADMVRLELEKEAHDLHKELDKLLSTVSDHMTPEERMEALRSYDDGELIIQYKALCKKLYQRPSTYPVRLLGEKLGQVDQHSENFDTLKTELNLLEEVIFRTFVICYLYENLAYFYQPKKCQRRTDSNASTTGNSSLPQQQQMEATANQAHSHQQGWVGKNYEQDQIEMLFDNYLQAKVALDDILRHYRWRAIKTGELRKDIETFADEAKRGRYNPYFPDSATQLREFFTADKKRTLAERARTIENSLTAKYPLFLWTVWYSNPTDNETFIDNRIVMNEKTSQRAHIERWIGKCLKEEKLKFPVILNDGTEAGLVFSRTETEGLFILWQENVEKDDRKYADKDACETIKTLCGGLEEYRKECGTAGVKDWPAHMTKVLEELNPGCHLAAAVTTDSEGGSASTPFTKLRKNYVNEYHHKTPGGQLKRMEWAWPLFRKPAVLNTIITRVDVVCSADLRAEFRTFSTDDCGRTWRQHGACKIDVKSWSDAEEKTKENTDQVEWNAMPFRQPLCLFQDSDAWYPASESPTTLEFLKAHLDRDHPRDDPRAFTCYPRNAVLTYLNESIYVTGGLDYTLGRASKMHFRMQMMDGRLHKPVPRDNMLEEVYGHSSCVFGNNIYFCGGFGRKGKRKTVQIYATRLTEKDSTRDSVSGTALTGHDQWVLGNPMLQAKANLGTAVLFNYLYAMDSSSCERMDLFEQKWEPLDYPADIQEKFKSDKKFFTSCCSQNGKLLVLFSSLTETDCAYHTSFDPTTEQWEPLAEVLFTINGVESAAVIFSKLFACEKTAPPFEELLKKDVNFAHFRELIRC